jgi:hypothetical protein
MLFFFLVHFSPCNVGLYSPVGGKNELEKKINIARGESHEKILLEKNQNSLILRGVLTYLPIIKQIKN